MSDKIKNWMIIVLCSIVVFSFFIISIIKEPNEISLSERRKLAQFPTLTQDTIKSGKFMKDFDAYAVDQFPFRENFRSLSVWLSKDIFMKKDIDKLYLRKDAAIAMEYPLQMNSLEYASKRFSRIYEKYFKDSGNKMYLSIIPDKSYFLNKQDYLVMDYQQLFSTMKQLNPNMTYIDISSKLKLDDYYRSDPHWREEKLIKVAKELGSKMGVSIETEYDKVLVNNNFCGRYCSQSANTLKPEKMYYLTNQTIENCRIYDHQNNKVISMYDQEKVQGKDPYEFYLSGPLSYITIENPSIQNGKELIIFRDSFTSSIAPLLATGYQKIMLLDIRYLSSELLQSYVEFKDQDVLFLYSTSVLNHSETLK